MLDESLRRVKDGGLVMEPKLEFGQTIDYLNRMVLEYGLL